MPSLLEAPASVVSLSLSLSLPCSLRSFSLASDVRERVTSDAVLSRASNF